MNESVWNKCIFGEEKGNLRFRNTTNIHVHKTWKAKTVELDTYHNHGQEQRYQGFFSSLMDAKMNIILG